jgi:hypothetical protein
MHQPVSAYALPMPEAEYPHTKEKETQPDIDA